MFHEVDKQVSVQPKQKEVKGKVLSGMRGRPRRQNMINFHTKIDKGLKARAERYVEQSIEHSSLSSLMNICIKKYLDEINFL